ncbi:MAG TPA: hypothetical protein VMF89_01800, partial [Polyangiales bacterium]|nr:hypothetical protein [Polyangiales bacterium]
NAAATTGSPLASTSPLPAAERARDLGLQIGADDGARAQGQTSARAQGSGSQIAPPGAVRAQDIGSQPTARASGAMRESVGAADESVLPSAAAPSSKAQQAAYASSKEKDAVPQRSDKEVASETLSKEVQLLQAAQLALRAGDTQRSLALLAEHTWTYPQGHLAEARDVARILALCQAGNVAQSKLHAKRFLQQRPESPYALRVRAGCAAMTDSREAHREPAP